MAIDIGDAVLTFLGDTSQLDQTFDKVQDKAASAGDSISPASDAVSNLGTQWKNTAAEAESAGVKTAAAGAEAAQGVETATETISLATRAASVFGEVLSTAFVAGSVFLLTEALFALIGRMEDLEGKAKAFDEAWAKIGVTEQKTFDSLSNDLLKAQIKTAELTDNHMEALRLKLQLIDNLSLGKLESELEKIAAQADKVLKTLEPGWLQRLYGFDTIDEVKGKFGEILKTVEEVMSPHTPQAYSQALGIVNKELADIQVHINELAKKDKPVVVGGFIAPGIDPNALKSYDELHVKLEKVRDIIQQTQRIEQQDKGNAAIEEQKKAADDAEKAAAKRKKAAEEEFKIYKDIFAARIAMEKDLEKQTDASAKIDDARLKAELKAEEEKAKKELDLLKQKEEAALAVLDGSIRAEQDADQQKAELLKIQYDKGLLTGQEYLAKLKQLYASEVQAVTQMLNQKQQLVILEAQNEAARRGQILGTEQAKELKAYIDIENKKRAVNDEFTKKFLQAEDQVAKKISKTYNSLGNILDAYSRKLRSTEQELTGFGKIADGILNDISNSFGSAIGQWIMGQESFGKALEKGLAQYLAQIAAKAAADAIYFTAWGFAKLAMWDFEAAANSFTAAAIFASVAGVAGASAYGLNAAAGGSGSRATNTAGASNSGGAGSSSGSATQPAQNPVQSTNIIQLTSGGLVNQRTLAAAAGGGGSNQGGNGTVFNVHIDGVISSDNLVKVFKRASNMVNKGQLNFRSSDSLRNTRRY